MGTTARIDERTTARSLRPRPEVRTGIELAAPETRQDLRRRYVALMEAGRLPRWYGEQMLAALDGDSRREVA